MKYTKPKDYYSYLFFLFYPVFIFIVLYVAVTVIEFKSFSDEHIFIQILVILFGILLPFSILYGLWEFNQFFYQYYIEEDTIQIKKLLKTYKISLSDIDDVIYKKSRLYSRGNVKRELSHPGMRITIKYKRKKKLRISIKMRSHEKTTIYKFLRRSRYSK